MAPSFPETKVGYRNLWNRCVVNPGQLKDADHLAAIIVKNKSVYSDVQVRTGVPWFVVGLIHMRESSFDFATHLHNGDSLTGFTFHVPTGRPQVGHGPPFTFAESAADALNSRGLNKITDWGVERILYELEAYNGWGYTLHGVNSPYLWSWTNLFQRGKYVRDGVWDSNFIDPQPGCAAILKRLLAFDPTLLPSSDDHSASQSNPPIGQVSVGPSPANQSSRPYRYSGVITIAGEEFEYATGGLNRGSAPFGTFLVTPEAIGPIGQRLGAIGLAHGEIDDPKYPGRPREGIELHPGSATTVVGLISEGCLVLLPSKYASFKKLLLSEIAKEKQYLTILPSGAAIIAPAPAVPEPLPATPTPPVVVLTHNSKEPPMSTVTLPTLDLASIEQTVEHFEFVVPFIQMVFPAAPVVVKAVEAALLAASAVQGASAADAASVAAAVLPAVQKLVSDLQALAPVVKAS